MTLNIKRAGTHEYQTRSAPRGWHFELIKGRGNPAPLIVRDGYHAVPCSGEAHSNAFIDNCGVCLHHIWGFVAVSDENKG